MREVRGWGFATAAVTGCVFIGACSLLVDTAGLSGNLAEEGGASDPRTADGSVLIDGAVVADASARDTSDPRDASAEGGTLTSPSCGDVGGPGLSDCGPEGRENCCASPAVPGGKFLRGYDGASNKTDSHEATVSTFRLDRFEVTVGRFRKFVMAVAAGWLPPPGSGKHAHVNGGKGLSQEVASLHESGWDDTWTSELATTQAGWTTKLSCQPTYQTWTNTVGANESRPIRCETWFEAYAFCIWDGGFLPTEAEWNYAASGGKEQRVYPWSSPRVPPNPPPPAVIDAT